MARDYKDENFLSEMEEEIKQKGLNADITKLLSQMAGDPNTSSKKLSELYRVLDMSNLGRQGKNDDRFLVNNVLEAASRNKNNSSDSLKSLYNVAVGSNIVAGKTASNSHIANLNSVMSIINNTTNLPGFELSAMEGMTGSVEEIKNYLGEKQKESADNLLKNANEKALKNERTQLRKDLMKEAAFNKHLIETEGSIAVSDEKMGKALSEFSKTHPEFSDKYPTIALAFPAKAHDTNSSTTEQTVENVSPANTGPENTTGGNNTGGNTGPENTTGGNNTGGNTGPENTTGGNNTGGSTGPENTTGGNNTGGSTGAENNTGGNIPPITGNTGGENTITPTDRSGEITPNDTDGKEISPDDGGANEPEIKGESNIDRDPAKVNQKPGEDNFKEAEGPKGPFKEGDIINYMYNEWLIGFANWAYEKVGKKLKEWGTAAYVAYLRGREESKVAAAKNHKKGKPHKTLDKYGKVQDEAIRIFDSQCAKLDNMVDSTRKSLNLIMAGKYSELDFGLEKEDKEKLLDAFSKSKEGKLSDEDRAKLPASIGNELGKLERYETLRSGKIPEKDLEGMSPEQKTALMDGIKKSGKSPLECFCKDTMESMENMTEMHKALMITSVNYATAKIGEELGKNKDFEVPEGLLQAYIKQSMEQTMTRCDYAYERGGTEGALVYINKAIETSSKAKEGADYNINNNIVMEHGARPKKIKGIGDFEFHVDTSGLTSAPENKSFTMVGDLLKNNVFDEKSQQELSEIAIGMSGAEGKFIKVGEKRKDLKKRLKEKDKEKKNDGNENAAPKPIINIFKNKNNNRQ